MDTKYSVDNRTLEEIQKTSLKIQNLSTQNQKNFNILNTDQKNNKNVKKLLPIQDKISHIVQQKYFSNNWYCSYTDNIDSQSTFKLDPNLNLAILTIHGCPGNQKEWLRLEKQFGQNNLRWINFITPGFDGFDERRGNYQSTIQDTAKMVLLLLQSLNIQKVILVGHSMGSYICYYFAKYYKEYVYGLVEASAAPIEWYLGMKKFHGAIVGQFDQNIVKEANLNDEKLRDQLYKQYQKNKDKYTMNMQGVGSIKMPNLTKIEFMASFKFFGRSYKYYNDIFEVHKSLPISLKFLCAGNTDIIIEKALFEKTFDYWNNGPLQYNLQKQGVDTKKLQQLIQQDPELNQIQFDFQNFQSNFIFMFDNTGHPVHNRRGQELGKPLRIYVKILIILEKLQQQNIIIKPKL